jgi:hypothetical protein
VQFRKINGLTKKFLIIFLQKELANEHTLTVLGEILAP